MPNSVSNHIQVWGGHAESYEESVSTPKLFRGNANSVNNYKFYHKRQPMHVIIIKADFVIFRVDLVIFQANFVNYNPKFTL